MVLTAFETTKDRYDELQFQMVYAHMVYKGGFDNILKLLENPPMDDLLNFAGYCEAWAISLQTHHDSEEEVVFPFLNTKMDFSGEEAAHKIIHAGIGEVMNLVNAVKADVKNFNLEAFKEKMVELRDPLFNHLNEEVKHIAGPNLKEAGFTEKEIGDMIDRLIKYAQNHGDPFLILPFMTSHTEPKLRSVWPALPWFLSKLVVPYVMAKRHSGYWKYAPYTP